jgi:ABC-type branched-subunit amino acid transport system ATPase component
LVTELLPGLADRRRALAHTLSVADHAIVLVLGNVRCTGGVAELEREVDLGRLFVEGKG